MTTSHYLIALFISALPTHPIRAQTAGEKFKNVTALKEMPADQMGKVMNIISQSLGVNCQHCHAGTDFAKEHVGEKDTAREMIEMTFKLNREAFKGRAQINCFTCHRGQAQPANDLILNQSSVTPKIIAQPDQPPTANDVINKYRTALGDATKIAAIKSFSATGRRVEPNGKVEREEYTWRSSGYSNLITYYGQLPIRETVDGDKVEKAVSDKVIDLKPDEARQIQLESRLLFGRELLDDARSLEYVERGLVEDSQVNILKRATGDQFMFDVESGLLVRRISSLPTVLGSYDYQVDYADYQELDGVKIPRTLRFTTPNISWTRVIESIKTP